MLHTNNPIIEHKAGLLNLAEELQNVSKACKVMGVSRDTFYRYQELVAEGGVEALIDKSRRAPNLKNRVDETIENAVKAYAVEFPAYGQQWVTQARCLRVKQRRPLHLVTAWFGKLQKTAQGTGSQSGHRRPDPD